MAGKDFIKANSFQLIILILIALGWIFQLIGLAMPNWTVINDVMRLGLFQQCLSTQCLSIKHIPSWLNACRAFAILALICGVVLIAFKVICIFTELFKKVEKLDKIIDITNMVLCFTTAGMVLLTVLIYGGFRNDLASSWALSILAALLYNTAGVLTLREF